MFFRVSNNLKLPADGKRINIRDIAYKRVLTFAMTSAALKLDEYLENKYNKSLKACCRELILHKILISSGAENNTFIVTFVDEPSNTLAKIITYGNSEIRGCDILKNAFDQKY